MRRRKVAMKSVAAALASASVILTSSVTAGAIKDADTTASTPIAETVEYTAHGGNVATREAVSTYSLDTVSNRSIYAYKAVGVSHGSRSMGAVARLINGEVYIPIRAFVDTFVSGAVVNYDSSSRTVTVVGSGYNISVSDGAYALYASGRVFFSKTPSKIMSDGRMYVPVSNISRAFSLNYSVDSAGNCRFSGTARPVISGSEFYDDDIVYWLSRIISAESRGEPLIGQIAVGNVVLNRVRSADFPNTVWGVIFDRKWGVQFSPVSNGTIYDEPSASSILAAKICLDGFSVSNSTMYFLRPSASSSSWIVNNREFLFVIGNHYFFV